VLEKPVPEHCSEAEAEYIGDPLTESRLVAFYASAFPFGPVALLFNTKVKIMKKVFNYAAGADIGNEKIFLSIEGQPVKAFRTFTTDLHAAITYLKENSISTVAMEATGVYWVVFYDLLECNHIEPYLVNPIEAKNVPGRKSDVQDCQWIMQLHSYGLLRRSFVPENMIRQLRVYLRQRAVHIETGSTYINRMQKSLTLMNIRLKNVINQIHGSSGKKIIQAILDGETDPEKLTNLSHSSILKKKKLEVLESLRGEYKPEHLFTLKQAFKGYCFCQELILECDKQIEDVLISMSKDKEKPQKINKPKPIRHHKPQIENLHEKLVTINQGKDACILPAITDYNLLQIMGETGTDLTKWPTEKHFTSWLKLSPGKHQSGKMNKRSSGKGKTNAGQLFKEAAQSLLSSKNIALGSFARRLRAKRGPAVAIKATARKLAEMYYRLFTQGMEFVEIGAKQYESQYKQRQIELIYKQAKKLNLIVTEIQPLS
jgi:transposase